VSRITLSGATDPLLCSPSLATFCWDYYHSRFIQPLLVCCMLTSQSSIQNVHIQHHINPVTIIMFMDPRPSTPWLTSMCNWPTWSPSSVLHISTSEETEPIPVAIDNLTAISGVHLVIDINRHSSLTKLLRVRSWIKAAQSKKFPNSGLLLLKAKYQIC